MYCAIAPPDPAANSTAAIIDALISPIMMISRIKARARPAKRSPRDNNPPLAHLSDPWPRPTDHRKIRNSVSVLDRGNAVFGEVSPRVGSRQRAGVVANF